MKKKAMAVLLVSILTLSISGCGGSGSTEDNGAKTEVSATTATESQSVSGSRNEEIILENPIKIIDNENVTVNVTRFFRTVYNEGTEYEDVSAGFEIEAENKMDGYEISLYPSDCSLSDRRVIEFAIWNSDNDVAPGKIATITYARWDDKDFENLNALYELEGYLHMSVRDENYSYPDLGGKLEFSIPKAMNAESIAAEANENREAYADVFAAISQNPWFFNGGDNSILNYIDFGEVIAKIGQVYFDGNGIHENGINEYPYVISDTSIEVTTDGGALSIPYSKNEEEVTLGSGDYYSLAQVEEGLQGYWTCTSHSDFAGTDTKYYILVDNGTLQSEWAAEANGGAEGEYYYYGPVDGTFTLGLGSFETDMRHGHDWFFNIVDGKPTVLHYDTVCEPADGFPGENGYSF